MTFHTTIRNLNLPGVFKAAEVVRGQRIRNAGDALALKQARQRAGSGSAASTGTSEPVAAAETDPADPNPETFAKLPAAQRTAVRERVGAVGWLAGTVLDAAPKLRPGRYRDALEQARSMGIPVDNLPPTYNPGIDGMLRRFRGEAQSLQDSLSDRER